MSHPSNCSASIVTSGSAGAAPGESLEQAFNAGIDVFFDGETVYGQPFSCSALSTPGSPASGVTLVGSLGDAQVVLACD